MWKYMNMEVHPSDLPTMNELLDCIREDGSTDRALADLRKQQMEIYQNELIWRFPISEGTAAGGFVMPVREGILWIPLRRNGARRGRDPASGGCASAHFG